MSLTFAWPFMLIGLAIVPIVLVLDVLARRRRARYAIAFTNVNVLRSVVARTPPWRRYLPLAFLLAALSAMVIGLARPERAVSVERRQATVLMAMDTSGSMVARDVSPTRLGAATSAAKQFVDGLPSSYKVSLVPFSTTASVAVAPTNDHTAVDTALSGLRANGGTAIGDAITLALAVGRPANEAAGQAPPAGANAGRVILLLSDGSNSSGIDPMAAAAQAKAEGVKVYTVAFGTPNGVISTGGQFGQLYPVPPDPATLKAVASATGGEFFAAADSDTLRHVYDNIGKSVGATTEKQDVSYAFAGLGAVLLAAAGFLSLLWRNPLA